MSKIQFNVSINRPAWTSEDLHSYNHKHSPGKIKKDYYRKKTKRRQNG